MSMIYIIRWPRHAAGSFLYGTELRFEKDGSVHVNAPLMPSGKVMHVWRSVTNFQRDRAEPELPVLIEGRKYRLRALLRTRPAETALLRVRFYDRQDELLQSWIPDSLDEVFTCPAGTYQYTVELVKSGFDRMHFHYLELTELDNDGQIPIRPM